MRSLLGSAEGRVVMPTVHSLCLRMLREAGSVVGVEDFKVCGADEADREGYVEGGNVEEERLRSGGNYDCDRACEGLFDGGGELAQGEQSGYASRKQLASSITMAKG